MWPHQRRMVRAAWMEKIMSKTNDTGATRVLTDNELDTVAGGLLPNLNQAVAEIFSVPLLRLLRLLLGTYGPVGSPATAG